MDVLFWIGLVVAIILIPIAIGLIIVIALWLIALVVDIAYELTMTPEERRQHDAYLTAEERRRSR